MIDLPYAEVIGDPIGHSKSPLLHGFWLTALGIDAEYRATHVTAEQLGAYFANRRDDPSWRGCNITLPHKLAALDHVDDPGGVRASIGAINLAVRQDGVVVGTNTDAAGFYAPLADLELAGRQVSVVGTGGAARAVLFALARIGVGPVTVLARQPIRAAALLARFGLKGDVATLDGPLSPDTALLVNASSLGMTGMPAFVPALDVLPDDAVVYDVVYAPLATPLLAAATERGLATVDGLEMLIGQAAVAFELLFGAAPPRDRDAELRTLLMQ